MYVCLCKGITDTHIKDAIYGGATTLRQVRNELGVMSQCGRCGVTTKKIIDDTLASSEMNLQEPALFYAAS